MKETDNVLLSIEARVNERRFLRELMASAPSTVDFESSPR